LNDLFADTLAEVAQVARGTVIRERKYEDGIAADQSGSGRLLRRRTLERTKDRRVAALRQLDNECVVLAFLAVVTRELPAEAAGLHTDDRVIARVEGLGFSEHLHANDKLLQPLTAPSERLFDDVGEKAFQPVGLAEGAASEDAIQLFAGELCRGAL